MNLRQLDAAIRPQFLWEPGTEWETVRWVEGGRNAGIMVFVGLSALHGIPKEYVCDYLNIRQGRYDFLNLCYRKFMFAALAKEFSDMVERDRAFSLRVLLKTRLAQSCLKHKYRAGELDYAPLIDYFTENNAHVESYFLGDYEDGNEG